MIIDITKCGYRRGYLPSGGVGVFHAFFPTANAAFRREALQAVGGFDTRCDTGEDIDLCIRVAQAEYELWFEPSARVTHFHRFTLRGLARQWFHYGYGHAYLYRKHGPRRRLDFFHYDRSEGGASPFGVARMFSLPSPLQGMVFVSTYHALHACLVIALAGLAGGAAALGWGGLVGALWFAARYFGPRFDMARPRRSLGLAGIRYLADSAYVAGGVLGGLAHGILFLEATFRTERRPRGAGHETDSAGVSRDEALRKAQAVGSTDAA